jgi:hypothetical protein
MATPPLPDNPSLRVRLDYQHTTSLKGGNRFFLNYTGSGPGGAALNTLAGDIATAWNTDLAPLVCDDWALREVDVLDITTDLGASGFATPDDAGSRSGTPLPAQIANNVEFNIAERYRGGKPRLYLPPGVQADLQDEVTWNSTFTGAVESGVTAFFAAVTALTVSGISSLTHVLLSYYKGYEPRTTGGGQTTFKPKYRTPNALSFAVTGYAPKATLGSQRRRRTSTTY